MVGLSLISATVVFGFPWISILLLLSLLLLSPMIHCDAAAPAQDEQPPQHLLECELFLADSTIPGAGIGVFSGVAKSSGEFVGNGDKAIPLVDIHWHNFQSGQNLFFNPSADYVWDGTGMGMRLEVHDKNDISSFWPGIDAMVNCHSGLLNLDKTFPIYDEGGVHRSKHHGAGSSSPYEAPYYGSSIVIRDIPAGTELFKSYGPHWFLAREWLGQIPLQENYQLALHLMSVLGEGSELLGIPPNVIYDDYVRPLKTIWDSRTLNALYDFSWDEIERALDESDIGVLLQPNATRSLDWLRENGKCLDHIVHERSTIDGAGAGAFAKRDLPKDTVVTGTPLLVFPDASFFDMYDILTCPDGSYARNVTKGPYGQQLFLNYCFGHHDSDMVLCPYGSGVNYINHNQIRANVKVQWVKDGVLSHKDEYFKRHPGHVTDYSTKVAFDYVATKDIAEGEELFLDYGDLWETEWNSLKEDWQTFDRTFLDNYVSATEYNDLYANDPLYTSEELLSFNPHPDNLSLRCHFLLDSDDYTTAEGIFLYDSEKTEELAHNWQDWIGDNTGVACEVLQRLEYDAAPNRYVVRFERKEENNVFRIVSNVPREAIKFFDNPYTTDMHMLGAFRQPIGIPDDMLPDAWRRTKTDKSKSKEYTTDDGGACANNPYWQQHEHHFVPSDSSRRLRYYNRKIRGR